MWFLVGQGQKEGSSLIHEPDLLTWPGRSALNPCRPSLTHSPLTSRTSYLAQARLDTYNRKGRWRYNGDRKQKLSLETNDIPGLLIISSRAVDIADIVSLGAHDNTVSRRHVAITVEKPTLESVVCFHVVMSIAIDRVNL